MFLRQEETIQNMSLLQNLKSIFLKYRDFNAVLVVKERQSKFSISRF